jgi:hypothetical protein
MVLRAHRGLGHRLVLTPLLRRCGSTALEYKLGHITPIEVLQEVLELIHDSNIIAKF